MSSNNYTFDEVLNLAKTNPDENIWCISMDGRVDFMMSAGKIAKTVGNFDWEGVTFMKLSKDDKDQSDEAQQLQCEPSGEFCIAKRKINNRVKIISSKDASMLEELVNQYLSTVEDMVNITYQVGQVSNIMGTNTLEYSAMIHYIEE